MSRDPHAAFFLRRRKPRLFLGSMLTAYMPATVDELRAKTKRSSRAIHASLRSMMAYGRVRRDGNIYHRT